MPRGLDVALLDLDGRRYERASAAERVLAAPGGPAALERPVPAGGSYTVKVVFDVPQDVAGPRLLVREGAGLSRLLERVLIGDEDALWHRPTLLALPRPAPAPPPGARTG
jgi:hypothetical protein